MNTPSKETAIKNWKKIFIIIVIIIVIATILFFTGNYPFEIGNAEFLINVVSTLIMLGAIYLILKHIYKPK